MRNRFPRAATTSVGRPGAGRCCLLVVALLIGWAATAGTQERTSSFPELSGRGKAGLALRIYEEVVDRRALTNGVGQFLLSADRACRQRAEALGKRPNQIASLAGAWLEYGVIVALKDRGKTPLVWQAEFHGLRDNFYDVVIFTREHGPVVLSPKTSLRERYKQADLEAFALRSRFPDARFFLLSLDRDKNHLANIRRKIANGETLGLTALYDETDADELFRQLEMLTTVEPPEGVLRSGRVIR